MLGLRTWQFVLIWDVAAMAGPLLGAVLGECVWGFDPSALLGGVIGGVLAASIMAFPARDKMRTQAAYRRSARRS